MPPLQIDWHDKLTDGSLACAGGALVCDLVFLVVPKHGVAVFAALSGVACVLLPILGVVSGVLALRAGSERLRIVAISLTTCAVAFLVFLLLPSSHRVFKTLF